MTKFHFYQPLIFLKLKKEQKPLAELVYQYLDAMYSVWHKKKVFYWNEMVISTDF